LLNGWQAAARISPFGRSDTSDFQKLQGGFTGYLLARFFPVLASF